MKKLLIICAVVLSAGLTSCKKDFTCACDTTAVYTGEKNPHFSINNTSKGDASDVCNDHEETIRKTDPGASCKID